MLRKDLSYDDTVSESIGRFVSLPRVLLSRFDFTGENTVAGLIENATKPSAGPIPNSRTGLKDSTILNRSHVKVKNEAED